MRWAAVFLTGLWVFVSACGPAVPSAPVENTFFLMDTVVKVTVHQSEPGKDINRAIQLSADLMQCIEQKTSAHSDSSEIVRINQNSGRVPVTVSPETEWILCRAIEISRQTGGLFDVSMGIMNHLWGFGTGLYRVPEDNEIRHTLEKVDYRAIQVENGLVLLQKPGMALDLGGIAKGYIIDQAVASLQSEGMTAGIVEAGGDLRIFGEHPKRGKWTIGVLHPRDKDQFLYGIIETDAASIATSGDYERFFIKNGKRYHHILNPRTGYSASQSISVTIKAEDALSADAYATAVFVLGPDKGIAFIESMPDLEGLVLYMENETIKHRLSSGMESCFTLYGER